MNFYEKIKRFGAIISELTAFYGELTEELPDLRIVVDNTRKYSDLKKTIVGKYYIFLKIKLPTLRRNTNEDLKKK